MHVSIVGAGVIGVTTAYYLSRQGHQVSVFDSKSTTGAGTSFANGGQLSYTFSDALASPGFVKAIPGLLAHRDIGARIRFSPRFLRWGLLFLAQCTRQRSDANTLATFRAALRSAELMHALRDHTGIEFDHKRAGKLVLLFSEQQVRNACRGIALKSGLGSDNALLSYEETVDIEPAIREFVHKPLAAVYSPGDEVGDAHRFCEAMRQWLEANTDTQFHLGRPVDRIDDDKGRVRGVTVAGERHAADAVVLCAGAHSPALAPSLKLPIEPMRGYSLTLPPGPAPPSVSVTVLDRHFVFSRLGDRMRIAGFADFRGYHAGNIADRVADLKTTAQQVGPLAADYDADTGPGWSDLRPMTPDSQPCIGATAVNGLFTNTGHGMLGWTLACVSGERLAQTITADV
ncbi:MAG: FAD-dependent oxidoreductase [Pseudomonadota bacterium]